MVLTEWATPRTEGRDAYRIGRPMADCPYAHAHHLREWREGWQAEAVASVGTQRHRFVLSIARADRTFRLSFVKAPHITKAMDEAGRVMVTGETLMSARYIGTEG